MGQIAWEQSRYEDAREYFLRSLEIDRSQGDRHGVAVSLDNLGTVAMDQGLTTRPSATSSAR